MANVGQIVKNEEGKLFLDLHIPFIGKERLGVAVNKKEKDGQPDFNVFGLYGKVGAIWNKTSKSGVAYKSMAIESISGKINFAIFTDNEQTAVKNGTKTHSVTYDTPKPKNNFEDNNYSNQQQARNDIPVVYEDGDSNEIIPF